MPVADWRQHDTPEARSAFQDAQARLDDGDYDLATETGRERRRVDEELTDRYDRLVLQPAHGEFERQCDEDEFNRHFPEPADRSRVEFEADGGILFGAFREDDPDHPNYVRRWYLYGGDEAWVWRDLVFRYQIRMEDLVILVPVGTDHAAARITPST